MINLTVVIDNDEAVKKLKELQTVAKTTTSSVVSDSERMDASMQKLRNTLAQVAAGFGMAQFAKQVVTVRGEFQALEIAMETMLGSKEKANKLMAEVTELAAKTPFDLQQVAAAAKQLLAFGSTADSVSKEIVMLGDIASGLSIPLGDLIYLYGTTRAQGRLFTQDLRQFMGRGIPLAKELATQFGVAEQEVGNLVTAGKVGFDDLKTALESLTAEGSMFGGGMERQSQGIEGRIAALQDSIQIMFNEIGESAEGLITGSIDAISWVTEHWKEFLSILKYVIAAYGSYKAALMVVSALHRVQNIYQMAKAFFETTKALRRTTQAMIAFNTVVKASPIGLLASVLGIVGASFIDLGDSAEEAASGIDDVEEASDNAERTIGRLEQAAIDLKDRINELFSQILDPNTSTEQRMMLLAKLTTLYPELAEVVNKEAISTKELTAAQEEYNKSLEKELELAAAKDKVTAASEAKQNANTSKSLALADLKASNLATSHAWFLEKAPVSDMYTTTTYSKEFSYKGTKWTAQGLADHFSRVAINQADEYVRSLISDFEKGVIDEATLASGLENIEAEVKKNLKEEISTITQQVHRVVGSHYSEYTRNLGDEDWNIDNIEFILGENKTLIKDYLDSISDVKAAETEYESAVASLKTIEPNYDVDFGALDDAINKHDSYKKALEELKFDLEVAKQGLDDAIKADDAGKVSYWSEMVNSAQEAYDDMAKPYEAYIKKQEKLREEEQKQLEKIADANEKLMNDAYQARVDAMTDGFDKEMAQLDLNYQQEIRKIEEQESELRKLQGGKLNSEQQSAFDALRNKALNDYVEKSNVVIFGEPEDYEQQAKIAEASWDEYLAEYGTFQERLAAIKRNYERKLSEANTEGEKAAIRRERDAVLAEYEVEATGFARDLANKTLSEIETITKQLQNEVDAKKAAYDALENSSSAEAQDLLKQIDQLNAKIKALEEHTGKASDNLAKDNWEGATEVFQNIAECANEAAEGLEDYDKGLASAFKAMGKMASIGVNLTGAIKGVKAAFDAAGKSVSAMEKASAILAIISVAIQAVSALVDIFKDIGGESQLDKTIRLFKELNTEIERMHEQSRINSFEGTIFGKDAFGNFNNNLAVMRDALKAFEDTQNRIAKRGMEFGFDYEKWMGDAVEMTDKSDLAIDRSKSWNSAYDSIANMQVQTKHKTWFTQAKYSSLEDLLPELFEGGELSMDALKELQQSDLYNKLSRENRELIDELIANWERYEEAVSATDEYLTDIFGNLGSTMTNALVDAFKNGTDAAEAFGEAASDVIERLSTDMIHSAFIQPIIDKYDEAIKAMNAEEMSPEERMAKLTQLIRDMSNEVLATQELVDEAAARVRDEAEANGIEGVYENEGLSQNATSRGFQAMSQETGSELNGRFTDIQGQTHRIAEAVEFCKGLHSAQLSQMQSINSTVAMIHNDTSLIEKHTRELFFIRAGIDRLNRNMEDL